MTAPVDSRQSSIAANKPGGAYAGAFDTLIAALLAADPAVVKTLSQRGQYTVFAPLDSAFAKLGLNPDNVATLGKKQLTAILLYHVAPGSRDASDVLASWRVRMLSGGFTFPSPSGTLTDNQGRTVNIVVTDVKTANGIIHAIDGVVLP